MLFIHIAFTAEVMVLYISCENTTHMHCYYFVEVTILKHIAAFNGFEQMAFHRFYEMCVLHLTDASFAPQNIHTSGCLLS